MWSKLEKEETQQTAECNIPYDCWKQRGYLIGIEAAIEDVIIDQM